MWNHLASMYVARVNKKVETRSPQIINSLREGMRVIPEFSAVTNYRRHVQIIGRRVTKRALVLTDA